MDNKVKAEKVDGAFDFVKSLPDYPRLYNDVLKPLKDKDDAYVKKVLEIKRQWWHEKRWREPGLEWEDELETFLTEKRGVDVFKEWLKVPYVHVAAKELFCTSSNDEFFFEKRAIKLPSENRTWVSLGHALADLKLTPQLQILLEEIPECGELMVSDYRGSSTFFSF
jgi:hypothetical protein